MRLPDGFKSSLDFAHMERMAAPMHRVLSELIEGTPESGGGRTAMVTTLVASLWQVAGRGMTANPPSLLLINSLGSEADPLNDFAAKFVTDQNAEEPGMRYQGPFAFGKPERAASAMALELVGLRKLGKRSQANLDRFRAAENRFFAAQRTGFGTGRTKAYSTAWHEVFDLLTDRDNEVILRLGSEEDQSLFLHHVLKDPQKIVCPHGYGAGLDSVVKRTSISGSLGSELWTEEAAKKMVDLGLPLIFVPHIVEEEPTLANLPAIEFATLTLPRAFQVPVAEPANLMPDQWSEGYGRILRGRLRNFPATYEYSVQRMARQLFPVCRRLTTWAGKSSGASEREMSALLLNLYGHTLRGIVIGITSLSWHGLGNVGRGGKSAVEVTLKHLRRNGPMTMVDLMRRAHLSKVDRDKAVEELVEDRLVQKDGREVFAVTLEEFVQELYTRAEFPLPTAFE